MKKEEIIEKSIRIITDYYNNDLEPFFHTISEDVLWIGPRGGHILHGREAILKAWSAGGSNQQFSMGNITVNNTSTGRNNLEVLLEYYVYTYFPNGDSSRHHQRLHYSWGYRTEEENGEKKKVPRICMIQISNIAADVEDPGQVYAASSSEAKLDSAASPFSGRMTARTIHAKGPDGVTYFFNSATILWIESTDSARHSIIHTEEGPYRCIEPVHRLAEEYADVLLRIHSGYLINPLYVRSVRRFEVAMTDGTVLSIPEKKYTRIRDRLENWGR